jgi:hypothetical protein
MCFPLVLSRPSLSVNLRNGLVPYLMVGSAHHEEFSIGFHSYLLYAECECGSKFLLHSGVK